MRRAAARSLALVGSGCLAALAVAADGGRVAAARPSLELSPDRIAIERAVRIGRGPEAQLQAFEEPYRIRLGGPTFMELEVVTPFRRVVLAARQRQLLQDSTWGYSEAAAVLQPYRGLVTLILRVALSPANVDYTLPAFDMAVYPRPGAGPNRLQPIEVRRLPQYITGQLAPAGSPVLGGLIEETFDAAPLQAEGAALVGLFADGREVQRVPVDFNSLR